MISLILLMLIGRGLFRHANNNPQIIRGLSSIYPLIIINSHNITDYHSGRNFSNMMTCFLMHGVEVVPDTPVVFD
jgi:hypothetical protein